MKRSLFFIVLIVIICSGTLFTSCKKDGDTIASITVLDTLGAAVPLATITLWQDTARNPVTGVQSTIRVTKTADKSGKASFTFPNEAFLNIWAISGTDTAFGFIRLVQYQTTEAKVRF